jgi:thiamine biosynthesis protein ThiI
MSIINNSNIIMVRFGELSTKGKNMGDFIRKLGDNIKVSLKEFSGLKYNIRHDHIYIFLNDVPFEPVKERLQLVPGLSSFSLVEALPRDIESVKKRSLQMMQASNKKTFKVVTKRIDKLFPMISDQINRTVAGYILSNMNDITVDVHHPELEIDITVREDVIYIYSDYYQGLGGYPVGIAGKGLMMISGGIDSPVASFLMMKRGVKLEMIHFAAPPYTSEKVIEKIRDICRLLNIYQPDIKIYVAPFTEIQKKIYEIAGTEYAITIMRIMMLRIAKRVAYAHNDIVIANGESIGQVASQTLKSMFAIEHGIDYPVIRPLATYDKSEIIAIAKKIGTFDISIRPYEDCCTIFPVHNPTTCPRLDKVKEILDRYDFSQMLDDTYKGIKPEVVSKAKEIKF